MWRPATVDMELPQGSTWDPVWTLRDAAGAPLDLTGWSARMKIRDGIDAAVELISLAAPADIALGGVAGTVAPTIAAATSAAWAFVGPSKSYVWDFELIEPGGAVRRVFQGRFVVTREATR
jgi:hypothetical protein